MSISLQSPAQPPPPPPVIDYLFPREGHGGEILIIQGYNFPTNTNNVTVSFCFPPAAGVEVPVLGISPTTIAVRVPTNVSTIFDIEASVCVQVGQQIGDSGENMFHFLPPPEITSVFPPNAVLPGGLIELRGVNFRGEAGFYRVLIDGAYNGFVELASGGTVLVSLPPNLAPGQHEIALQLHGAVSNPMSFNVVRPRYAVAGTRTNGLSIRVTRANFSNAPDGEISLLEAVLIANGTLGRPIERHLPCETLPPEDPNKCPPQRRESDSIQFLDEGPNGGLNSADFVFLDSSITNGTEVFGTLPPLTGGDAYVLRIVLNGQGAPAGTPGLDLNGVGHVSVDGLTLRNYPGHGIWLRSNAFFNSLNNIKVENCAWSGAFLDNDVRANRIFGLSVSNAGHSGLSLQGSNVFLNRIEASGGHNTIFGEPVPFSHYVKCGGNGIRLVDGPTLNVISPGTVRENTHAGILLWGPGVSYNLIGRSSDEAFRAYDVVSNGLEGVRVVDGVRGCVVRYINAAGNARSGILLDGDVRYNQVDRCSVGANLYEGGTRLDLPNQGSGIHLSNGPQYNLIGSHVVSIGDMGTICGNRDDGILIEGNDTAYNTVCAQQIGIYSITFNPFVRANFVQNGKSGIRLRDGTHHNTIGEWQYELPNRIFTSPEAAIMIEGSYTRENLISGNQIGAYHQEFAFTGWGENYIGVWIRDGAYSNSVGWPGNNVAYSRFSVGPPDSGKFFWNVIDRCWVGVLIESTNAFGLPCFDNTVRNNLIGEEERGALAQGATGIKLGYGAYGTRIGGPHPSWGNRIRGNWRAGIWILNNHVPDFFSPNVIENNYISDHGFNGFLRYPGMLSFTPSGGVGLLVENSSGQYLGTTLRYTNIFEWNRIGIYLADSTSNYISGNYISNQFLAGIIVRGGHDNLLGGDESAFGNVVSGYGLGDPGHAGVALSSTWRNTVQGNFINNFLPRAGMGVFLTNAVNNTIGGDDTFWSPGNIIVNNTNGMVLSGTDSANNFIYGNYIGVLPDGTAMTNRGDGIRIENGAYANYIGATNGPNYIWYNREAGVRIDGSNSTYNTILANSITANGSRGIVLTNGGNFEVRAPSLYRFDGTNFFGNAALEAFPENTWIQAFCDSDPADPEGDIFLGEGMVGPDGSWRVPIIQPISYPHITLTASHTDALRLFFSTSEFGGSLVPPDLLYGFAVSAAPVPPVAPVFPPGAASASVFHLSLFASNTVVRVDSMTFEITGTLPDASAIANAYLYHDVDANAGVSAPDVRLAGPVQFTVDNGRITLSPANAVIDANTTERWLLVFDLASTAPVGANFQLAITNATAVSATFVYPPNLPAIALGIFPIHSQLSTIGEPPAGQTIAAWKQTVFSAAQLANPAISGNDADPDGDGLNNLHEYAYNLNPLVADRDLEPTGDRGAPKASRVLALNPATSTTEEFLAVTFIRRKEPVDLNYFIDHSFDLLSWNQSPIPTLITVATQQDVGAGGALERVQYRATQPITGQGSAPKQFFRIRVELVP